LHYLVSEGLGAWRGLPTTEYMLNEVDSLLKTVQLNESTHLFLATIEDQVNLCFLLLPNLVLL